MHLQLQSSDFCSSQMALIKLGRGTSYGIELVRKCPAIRPFKRCLATRMQSAASNSHNGAGDLSEAQ